jgi:hypothetical protein
MVVESTQISRIFSSFIVIDRFWHTGGDEPVWDHWRDSPSIRKFMTKSNNCLLCLVMAFKYDKLSLVGVNNVPQLLSYVTARLRVNYILSFLALLMVFKTGYAC